MTRLGRTRPAQRSEADQYQRVGEALLDSANALKELASEDTRYGNAIGVLAVHAAIAWTDALCIAFGAQKSTDGEHSRAADVLQAILGPRANEKSVKLLRSVLGTKDKVAYVGDFYTVSDGGKLLKKATQYIDWARALYAKRPPAR